MQAYRFAEIKVDQRIAAEHHEGVVKEVLEILDFFEPASRPQGTADQFAVFNPSFKAVGNFNPETLAIPEVIFNLFGQVGDVHHHFGETVLLEQFQQKFHHRLLQDRNHRLGDHMGDRLDPRPLTSRQNHRLHWRLVRSIQGSDHRPGLRLPRPSGSATDLAPEGCGSAVASQCHLRG